MAFSVTYDASHKVKAGGSHLSNFCRHIARDADERNGMKYQHANKNIDASRTRLNTTWVRDAETGRYQPATGSQQLEDAVKNRLGAVTKKLRKDATVLRPLVLQLDPKYFEEECPDWKERGLPPHVQKLAVNKMLGWAMSEFGKENIVFASLHLDEYAPQLQVGFVPVTEDGRLSQKDFFKGPTHFKAQRKELLDRLTHAGFDAEYRTTERSREHLSSSEYQSKAERVKEAQKQAEAYLDDAKEVSAQANNQLAMNLEREDELDEREMKLRKREKELEEKLAQYEIDNSNLKIREGEARNLGYAEGVRLAQKEIEDYEEKLCKAIEEAQAVKDSANAVVADAVMMRDAFTRVNKRYKAHAPAWFTPEEIKTINSNLQVAQKSSVKLKNSSLTARQAQSRLSQAQSELEL